MSAKTGLEMSFLESFEDWDEVGDPGDICFYDCKLKPLPYVVVPKDTDCTIMTLLMGKSIVQFEFYKEDQLLSTVAFKIKAVLEEEIKIDN